MVLSLIGMDHQHKRKFEDAESSQTQHAAKAQLINLLSDKRNWTSLKEEPRSQSTQKKDLRDALTVFTVITELLGRNNNLSDLVVNKPLFARINKFSGIQILLEQSSRTNSFYVYIGSPAGHCTVASGTGDSFIDFDFSHTPVKLLDTKDGHEFGEVYTTYYVRVEPKPEIMQ